MGRALWTDSSSLSPVREARKAVIASEVMLANMLFATVETTILNCRHFLEKHDLPKTMFEQVNVYLEAHELMVKQ